MSGITVDRKQLVAAITKAKPAIVPAQHARKTPALGCVRLTADGKRLRVAATDLDNRIELSIPGAGSADLLVPGVALLATLKSSTEPTVTIEHTDAGPAVKLNGSVTTLPKHDLGDWPTANLWHDGEVIPLDDRLSDAILRVSVAASGYAVRPILTGIHFDGSTVVATDSYRLAWATVRGAKLPEALLPASSLVRALKGCGRHQTLILGESSAVVCGTDCAVTMRRIVVEFPNWKQLRPKRADLAKLALPREPLIAAVKGAERFVKGTIENPVRLATEDGKTLALSATLKGSDATWESSCPIADGSLAAPVAFNPTYLREGLEAMRGDTVTLEYADSLRPWLMAEGNFGYLLMPVRRA